MITADKANELRNELEEVRGEWADWIERWTEYQRTLRHAGYNTFRLDAYQVGVGSDEGGGQSMVGWLDEIEADLMGEGQ
jgi:hypothetical protein